MIGMGRRKLPEIGTCSICNRDIKLLTKGKNKLCRTCYDKIYKTGICKTCGKMGKMQGGGYCHACYYRLGLSGKKIICSKCKKEKSHYAKGMCLSCYGILHGKMWRKNNPEKFRELMKKAQKKWKEKNPEKWREYMRKAGKKRRAITPERCKRIEKCVSFVTSDGMGSIAGKIPAKCVYKGELSRWVRIVVYELPNSFDYDLPEKRQFKVQIIDIKSGKETFENLNGKELIEKYNVTKGMFADYQNRQVFGGHGTYS